MTRVLAHELLELRARWRNYYLIALHDGVTWTARPVFDRTTILTAETAAELAAMIVADHAARSAAEQG